MTQRKDSSKRAERLVVLGSLGEGAGHMRLKTMSGDIELCDRI